MGHYEGRKGWNLVNRNVVTKPRQYGDFGVRQARATNVALLGKLVWEFLPAFE